MINRVKISGCRYPVCAGMEADPIDILAPQNYGFSLGPAGRDRLNGPVIYADINHGVTENTKILFMPISETGSDI